jgi:hypothetical protein
MFTTSFRTFFNVHGLGGLAGPEEEDAEVFIQKIFSIDSCNETEE